MKFAFAGKMCSGKSTAAKYIEQHYVNARRVSFADPVKNIARTVFGMEEKDRKLLQIIGATGRALDPNMWINKLLDVVRTDNEIIWVVDDVRYLNELRCLKGQGFTTVYIDVPEDVRKARILKLYGENAQQHIDNMNDESETALEKALVDGLFDRTWKTLTTKELRMKCLTIM